MGLITIEANIIIMKVFPEKCEPGLTCSDFKKAMEHKMSKAMLNNDIMAVEVHSIDPNCTSDNYHSLMGTVTDWRINNEGKLDWSASIYVNVNKLFEWYAKKNNFNELKDIIVIPHFKRMGNELAVEKFFLYDKYIEEKKEETEDKKDDEYVTIDINVKPDVKNSNGYYISQYRLKEAFHNLTIDLRAIGILYLTIPDGVIYQNIRIGGNNMLTNISTIVGTVEWIDLDSLTIRVKPNRKFHIYLRENNFELEDLAATIVCRDGSTKHVEDMFVYNNLDDVFRFDLIPRKYAGWLNTDSFRDSYNMLRAYKVIDEAILTYDEKFNVKRVNIKDNMLAITNFTYIKLDWEYIDAYVLIPPQVAGGLGGKLSYDIIQDVYHSADGVYASPPDSDYVIIEDEENDDVHIYKRIYSNDDKKEVIESESEN